MVSGHSVANPLAIIIFTRAPIPGSVKTRLCPPLTADEAASLHGSLILDTMERAQSLSDVSLYVAGMPDVAHPFFKVLEGRYGARLLSQRGADIGSRMCHALEEVFALGHSRVALIGTDLPTLPREYMKQALDLLHTHDVVLGPTVDGGYYLIGMQRLTPELFCGIAWSTPTVLQNTRQKATEHGLSVALLPESRDLDDLQGLQAFIALVGKDRSLTKRTAGALRLLAGRLKERNA